jgi:hypothetical protein
VAGELDEPIGSHRPDEPGDLIKAELSQLRHIGTEEPHLLGVGAVVLAHPLDQRHHLLALPRRHHRAHDLAWIADTVHDVAVHRDTACVVGLPGERAEPPLLHQVSDDPVAQGELIAEAVRGLAEPDHPRIPDQVPNGRRLVHRLARVHAAERNGSPIDPLDDRVTTTSGRPGLLRCRAAADQRQRGGCHQCDGIRRDTGPLPTSTHDHVLRLGCGKARARRRQQHRPAGHTRRTPADVHQRP